MMLTAELRLWWQDCPPGVERLFAGLECERRSDVYLLDPGQPEVGIKKRGGGGVEIKLLVARLGEHRLGRAEMWVKSRSAVLDLHHLPTVKLRKARRMRQFRTCGGVEEVAAAREVAAGCRVEWTRVEMEGPDAPWWTLGFEAEGAMADVERSLGMTVDHVAHEIPPGCIEQAICAGYPEWLSRIARA